MRNSLVIMLGMLTSAPAALAQSLAPGTQSSITTAEIEVRSGPTDKYYATSKLRFNDRVVVVRQSEQAPDWLAIMPPQGSFSWINQKFVKQVDARTGIVTSDGAVVRPGSSVSNKPPDVDTVKIPIGSQVTIVGQAKTADDGAIWLPINPWPTEVRFIPANAVQTRLASNSANINGVVANPTQSSWSPAQVPGNPAVMQGNPWQVVGQTASYSQPSNAPQKITYPPQWTQWGTLRRSVADKDGQPTYILEDAKGKVLLYVNCQPGFTLRDYVGRSVSIYGTVSYRSDDQLRTHVMTASHISAY